ncbi:MAG: hypothetical protein VX700_05625, partial [Pseudomonadota bacterium]|nr:hypothetical protein [Pseudomonadota bacterium]
NNVGCYLLINTDYPASQGDETSQPKQIYLRSSTYGTGLGHGPLLEATETIGDATNYKKWFKRPIAIEPFIEYSQKLIDETPPAVA